MLRPLGLFAAILVAWSAPGAAAAPEQDATATLDAWLAAQNEGRFDDYQKLYSDGFTGVRRSGTRVASFDRAGWMKDRQRMFRKPMKVEAEKVRIIAKKKAALVAFNQRWSSGNYSDVGPKHLVLRRTPAGYRIVREELFASRTGKGAVDVAAFRQFAFVLEGRVVVSDDPDEGWASGPPVIEHKDDDYLVVTRRPVDVKKLPPAVASLVGTRIHLMDNIGVRCEARLGAFHLHGRVIGPEFAEPDNDLFEPWSNSNRFLVADIEGDVERCAGATWARAANLPDPKLGTARAAPAEHEKLALESFRALPATRAIQREFAAWHRRERPREGKAPAWFQLGQGAQVRSLRTSDSGTVLLSVTASYFGDAGQEPCSELNFGGSLGAIWRLDGTAETPRLVLVNRPDPALIITPTAAVDVDGDGQVELLFDDFENSATSNVTGRGGLIEHGLLRPHAGTYMDVEGPETQVYICPC
jgi:ketosteroid isomerase-like protein